MRGCRAGYQGFLCATCQSAPTRYFKAPSGLCTPCEESFWAIAPVLAGVIGFCLICALLCFKPVLWGLKVVLSEHELRLSVLKNHAVRLALLNRLSLLRLPSVFRWFLGVAGIIFGVDTARVGAECAAAWGFQQKFWLVVGGTWVAVFVALLAVDLPFMWPKRVQWKQWRVWDVVALLLPFAAQTSFEAVTYRVVSGEKRVLVEPATLLLAQPHYAAYSMGVFVLLFAAIFYFFRHAADRFLKITHDLGSWAVYRNAEIESFHEDLIAVLDCVQFFAFFAIPLQMLSATASSALLLALCGADVALLIARHAKMREFLTLWPTIGVLVASVVTYGASLYCVVAGGCGGSAGLGWFLIILNCSVLLGVAWKPLRQGLPECAKCCALRSHEPQGRPTPVSHEYVEGTEVVCWKRVRVPSQNHPQSSVSFRTPQQGVDPPPPKAQLKEARREARRVSPARVVPLPGGSV